MISVCVATHNGEKYIHQQLSSILSQLSPEDEVIISDDRSSDDTLSIIRSFDDARITILHHTPSTAKFKIDYATRNFENALNHSKGEIVFLADQDDVWFPNKIETVMAALDNADIIMSDCTTTDPNLNIISKSYYQTERKFKQSILANIWKPAFLGACMAFKRDVVEKSLPFPPHGVGHDLWLGIIGLKHFRFTFVNEPLIYYRRHSDTVTDGGKDNNTSLWFKIKYRLYVLYAIVSRLYVKR